MKPGLEAAAVEKPRGCLISIWQNFPCRIYFGSYVGVLFIGMWQIRGDILEIYSHLYTDRIISTSSFACPPLLPNSSPKPYFMYWKKP